MSRSRASDVNQAMGAPGQMPSSAPTFPSHDHSFTLQTVMELQKTVGVLQGNVSALSKTIDDHCTATERQLDRALQEIKGVVKDSSTGAKDDHKQVSGDLKDLHKSVHWIKIQISTFAALLIICGSVGGWFANNLWQLISSVATPAIQDSIKAATGSIPKPTPPSSPSSPSAVPTDAKS